MQLALTLLQLAVSVPQAPMSFDTFLARVRENHPIVRQARLLDTLAAAQERVARGAFDPRVGSTWERKAFDDKTYFDYADVGLTIPTSLGVDFKIGFERARGAFTATDRQTPDAGLLTAGVSFPIGQRLVTDTRRVALAQARALRGIAAAEREAVLNRLFASSVAAWAEWFESEQRHALASDGVRLATFRLEALRSRVRGGDLAAIDTVEGALELQRRRVQLEEADLARRNAAVTIEGLLWNERGEPEALAPGAVPASAGPELQVDSVSVLRWLTQAMRQHPEVRKADAKVIEEEAVRALARQRTLVPDLTAAFSRLASAGAGGTAAPDDAKVSLVLGSSLLLRQERGRLQMSATKVAQLRIDQALAARAVAVSVGRLTNEMQTLSEMIVLQREAVRQARELLAGEERKFAAGESTLFLVNARERAVLDEEGRRIALEARRVSTIGRLAVAVGEPVV